MFEQSSSEIPSSLWSSMISWFTPAVFFVILNLMIATIALTSALANKKTAGSGSAVLHRLKSTNFYPYFNRSPQEPHNSPTYKQAPDSAETRTSYFFQENCVQAPQDSSIGERTPDSDALFVSGEKDSVLGGFQEAHHGGKGEQEQSPGKTRARFVSAEKDSILGGFEDADLGGKGEQKQSPEKPRARFVSGEKDSILGVLGEARHGGKGEQERSPEKTPARFVSSEKDLILGGFEGARGGEAEESEPGQSMDEVFSRLAGGGQFGRTKSDTVPASGEVPAKLPAKMKKSASLKSAFGHFEEEKIVEARRPATVREARVTDGDVEVDAKADDFISRFKQQLRIQRLDSIIRYKDVIGRVSGGR